MPRRQFLFIGKKEPKTMSAEPASLKIGCTSLKVRNLPYVRVALKTQPYNGFKQTDFLRFVSPIFLTLTSQGGNQGIA